MKSLQLLPFLFPAAFFGQLASGIAVHNTRDVNNPPSDFGHQVQADFKNRSIVGAPGEGTYSGMLTIAPWSDNSGDKHHQLNFNNGGVFYRNGLPQGQWEGWKQLLMSESNGKLGIGNNNPRTTVDIGNGSQGILIDYWNSPYGVGITAADTYWARSYSFVTKDLQKRVAGFGAIGAGGEINSLFIGNDFNDYIILFDLAKKTAQFTNNISVSGKVEAKEVKVTNTPTADFVFEENYNLPTLESIEKHIKEKKHLPEVASAAQMQKEGVNIGEFQIKLLQKIEELTLYTIEQSKVIKQQQQNIEKLQNEVKALQKTN